MIETARSYGGMVSAPHHLAAQAGLRVLDEQGNAIEAMIAAAAAIAVVYPHMNGLGGDGFWLIGRPGAVPIGIQACGRAAAGASRSWYREQGCREIPARGALAALTVAGAVSGWQAAWDLSRTEHAGRMPMARLLEDAVRHAREGIPVAPTLHRNTAAKLGELRDVPGFAELHLEARMPRPIGARLRQQRLAATLERLGQSGLDDFYRGEVARAMAADLEAAGSPLCLADLETHRASLVAPLAANCLGHTLYNLPPPTQGLASLMVLALYARMPAASTEGADYVHRLVECSKAAFRVRDRHVTDPDYMSAPAAAFLARDYLDMLAQAVSPDRAAPWPHPATPGETVWLAAADGNGLCVSYIQSIYWEFGSGLVLPSTGVTWQNRGTSFSLEESHLNQLEPGRLPFHTIQPAMAQLAGGRLMAYGTMGGDGQPQTQAAIFTRHVLHGHDLQGAVSAPRWLLGRTWGEETANLKLERRFGQRLVDDLARRGHDIQVVGDFEEMMGHAGAIVRHPDGLLEGASDPRSDGAVAAR